MSLVRPSSARAEWIVTGGGACALLSDPTQCYTRNCEVKQDLGLDLKDRLRFDGYLLRRSRAPEDHGVPSGLVHAAPIMQPKGEER